MTTHMLPDVASYQCSLSRLILDLSTARWGREHATILIGRHPRVEDTLTRLVRFAVAEGSVLITGETGTGKDLLARSLFLTAKTHRRTLISVNCAQFQNAQLAASELFGHRRGAFTGAVADHAGIFAEANGGFVFLDEVAELPLAVQAMLLRSLNDGEVVPVGTTQARRVDTRVIAATNRDLPSMVSRGLFREDLYYRLRHLTLHAPPLRERGDDWLLLSRYLFDRLAQRTAVRKRFSEDAIARLAAYHWPGNIRELASCVEVGYHVGQSTEVIFEDVIGALQASLLDTGSSPAIPFSGTAHVASMAQGETTFWMHVHGPFMNRELNRAQVRDILAAGLRRTNGSFKRLVTLFGMPDSDYPRFMDFLRHHELKPIPTAPFIARGRLRDDARIRSTLMGGAA